MLHVTLSFLSVGRAKMLHVTSWDLAGVRTGVTCYIKFSFGWQSKDVTVTSWDLAGVRTRVTCYIKFSFCWQSKHVTCYVMGLGWN